MAISYDNKNRVTGATGIVTITLAVSHLATLVVCTIVSAGATARSGGAPTYQGVTMIQADTRRVYTTNPEAAAEMFYIVGQRVQAGITATISVPNTNTRTLHVVASSYISQSGYTSVFETSNGSSGLSSNPSVSTTVTAGGVVVAVMGNGGNSAPTGRSGTTLYEIDNGAYSDDHQYTLSAGGGSVASSWTISTDDWGMCVAAFGEAVLKYRNPFSIFQNPAGV